MPTSDQFNEPETRKKEDTSASVSDFSIYDRQLSKPDPTSGITMASNGRSLLDLAPELRNKVYELVFEEAEMLITVRRDGVGQQGLRPGDALRATCKQVRSETGGYVAARIDKLVVKPDYETTPYGGDVVKARFNLDKWLKAGPMLPLQHPLQVELHVGMIDIIKLDSDDDWKDEMGRIIRCVPGDRVRRQHGVKLTIKLNIIAHPAVSKSQVEIPMSTDHTEKLRAVVREAMRVPQRDIARSMPVEWTSLDPEEVTALRRKAWHALHTAQERIRWGLSDLYYM